MNASSCMSVRVGGEVNVRYQMRLASWKTTADRGGGTSAPKIYASVVYTTCDRWWWWLHFGFLSTGGPYCLRNPHVISKFVATNRRHPPRRFSAGPVVGTIALTTTRCKNHYQLDRGLWQVGTTALTTTHCENTYPPLQVNLTLVVALAGSCRPLST